MSRTQGYGPTPQAPQNGYRTRERWNQDYGLGYGVTSSVRIELPRINTDLRNRIAGGVARPLHPALSCTTLLKKSILTFIVAPSKAAHRPVTLSPVAVSTVTILLMLLVAREAIIGEQVPSPALSMSSLHEKNGLKSITTQDIATSLMNSLLISVRYENKSA